MLSSPKNVLVLNSNCQTRNSHIALQIVDEISKSKGISNVKLVDYENAIQTASSEKYDILLVVDGQKLNKPICGRLSKMFELSILWVFEDPYTLGDNLTAQGYFDVIFSNDASSVNEYSTPAFHVPLAASKTFFEYNVSHNKKYDYDIFFCGSAWPNRVEIIKKLIKDRPHLKFKIVLQESPYIPPANLEIPESSYIGSLNFINFRRLCNRSKIVLGLHRQYDKSGGAKASDTPGPRVFEISEAGGFQLIDTEDANIDSYFKNDCVATFSNYNEMLEKIDYYLENDIEREKKAKRAKQACERSHLYRHRLNIIESIFHKYRQLEKASEIQTSRSKVLYVTHNSITSNNYGGLELHQNVLSRNVRSDFEVYFFHIDRNEAKALSKRKKSSYILMDSNYKVVERFLLPEIDFKSLNSHREYEKVFSTILLRYNFDLVHFLHFLGNLPSFATICRSLGVPYLYSIHDFYSVCESFNLLDYSGNYCKSNSKNLGQCDICLFKTKKIPKGSQQLRRVIYEDVLMHASSLVAVSQSCKDILIDNFPSLANHKNFYAHGAPLPVKIYKNQEERKQNHLSILIMGNLAPNKGGNCIIQILEAISGYDSIFFGIYGRIDDFILKSIRELKSENIYIHGAYKPGDVPVENYDLSLHLSNWPETYCQTLSESWFHGVVPIVTDIGALGERVSHGVNGFKVNVDASWEVIRIIEKITHHPSLLVKIKSNINSELYLNQAQHAKLFISEYSRISSSWSVFDGHEVTKSDLSMDILNYKSKSNSWIIGKGEKVYNNNSKAPKKNNYTREHSSDLSIIDGGRGHIDSIGNIINPADEIKLEAERKYKITGWFNSNKDNIGIGLAYGVIINKNSGFYYFFPAQRLTRDDLVKSKGIDFGYKSLVKLEFEINKEMTEKGGVFLTLAQKIGNSYQLMPKEISISINPPLQPTHFKKDSNKVKTKKIKQNKFSRKYKKFVKNPRAFFMDSKSVLMKKIGGFIYD